MPIIATINSTSFSGSTLLTFLLNAHSQIFTVGHMIGYRYAADEDFRCSCGETLELCPFFSTVMTDFRAANLPFSFRDFGTRYELSRNDRINRFLTTQVRFLSNTAFELARDFVVRLNPLWAARLDQQNKANLTFVDTALAYSKTKVFVDSTHSPYRLRKLNRIEPVELYPIQLLRDFRGVVYSHIKNKGWDVELSWRTWLREQHEFVRILPEFERTLRIHYEDLCADADGTLGKIHAHLGLAAEPFSGDFKATEHHVLGNQMRLGKANISQDHRWLRELKKADLAYLTREAERFVRRHPGHPVSQIIEHYVARTPQPSSAGAAPERSPLVDTAVPAAGG